MNKFMFHNNFVGIFFFKLQGGNHKKKYNCKTFEIIAFVCVCVCFNKWSHRHICVAQVIS